MKAGITKIFSLLNRDDKHYVIPLYQRLYSWRSDNCQKLFDDIVDLMDNDKTHFMGSIVEITHDERNSGILAAHVLIDGQQRFTTFTLFILALMEHFIGEDKEAWNEMKNTYLVNKERSNDEHYKLLLIEKDMNILRKIINKDKLSNEDKESLIFINFNFLKELIASMSEYSFEDFKKSLNKLEVVIIDLDNADNPQLIFESINSTGLDLSQGDLIKNYILMDLKPEEQKNVYKEYWKEMEDELIRFNQLDNFFKHFLSIKNGKIPNSDNIYEEFKKYHQGRLNNILINDFVEEIYNYFEIFYSILKNSFKNETIKKSIKNLSLLKVDVINPLLIELFSYYKNKNNLINVDDLNDIDDLNILINTFISYIIRRQFCGLPTGSLNKVFMSLINVLKNNENKKEAILSSLLNFENTQIFPSDNEFKESFISKNFYSMKSKNAILEIIENNENKKELVFSEYTVEHILPQGKDVPKYWIKALGDNWSEKFETWVHTIGNITLTLYNSEYSNRDFETKKTMENGFLESQLKLNKFLVKCDEWNAETIKERAENLFDYCLKIWTKPILEKNIREKYADKKVKNIDYDLMDHKYYSNGTMKKILDKIINFSENINPNIVIIPLKSYVKVQENDDILASLVIEKKRIKIYFNMKKHYIDEQELCRNMDGIGHWGVGNTEIIIDETNFEKCSKIIAQIMETDN